MLGPRRRLVLNMAREQLPLDLKEYENPGEWNDAFAEDKGAFLMRRES